MHIYTRIVYIHTDIHVELFVGLRSLGSGSSTPRLCLFRQFNLSLGCILSTIIIFYLQFSWPDLGLGSIGLPSLYVLCLIQQPLFNPYFRSLLPRQRCHPRRWSSIFSPFVWSLIRWSFVVLCFIQDSKLFPILRHLTPVNDFLRSAMLSIWFDHSKQSRGDHTLSHWHVINLCLGRKPSKWQEKWPLADQDIRLGGTSIQTFGLGKI